MQGRRLTRSRTERLLGGVAGGIAEYTNIDPLWVRLAFLVLSLFNGLGAMIYVVLWLLTPVEGTQTTDTRSQVRENVNDMQEATQRFAQQVRDMFRSS
jgi:phage shock protein C